jgi:hypothetical protein
VYRKIEELAGTLTSCINFLFWIICKEVSLLVFAVYRKSKGGCEVDPTSAQYTSAATHLFGWRTYHPGWHWCCLYIVATVSVCSRHKLQVSSVLLIEVCHRKFYITLWLIIHTNKCIFYSIMNFKIHIKIHIKTFKTLLHVRSSDHPQGAYTVPC